MGKRLDAKHADALRRIGDKLHPGERVLASSSAVTKPPVYSRRGGAPRMLAVTDRRLVWTSIDDHGEAFACTWFQARDMEIRHGLFGSTLRFAVVHGYPHDRGEARVEHRWFLARSAARREFLRVVQSEWDARADKRARWAAQRGGTRTPESRP